MQNINQKNYNDFIDGVELRRVRLISTEVKANNPIPNPAENAVEISESYSYEINEQGFEAICDFKIQIKEKTTKKQTGRIDARFGFAYTTKHLKDKELKKYLEMFITINLPVNTWPYIREYIQNMMARMNWPQLTLPLRKTIAKRMPAKNLTTKKAATKTLTKKPA